MATPTDTAAPLDRVWTVPNVLTFVRLALIPVFVWLLVAEHSLAALILFAALSGTDFVDGKIARRFNQVSKLGTMLDPVADRVLILTALVVTVLLDIMPLWLVALLLVREVVISIWTLYLKSRDIQLAVIMAGKWAATFVFFSIVGFLAAEAFDGEDIESALRVAATLLGVAGIVLGYATLIHYFREGRSRLAAAAQTKGTV